MKKKLDLTIIKDIRYAIKSPSGGIYWSSVCCSKQVCVDGWLYGSLTFKSWRYWWKHGYRVVKVGELTK